MKRILFALFLLLLPVPGLAGQLIEPGKGSFRFEGWPASPLTVWTHAPDNLSALTPVVFVMHGLRRNGADYRDQWADLSAEHGFLVLVPEFPEARFPKARSYNLGNVKAADGSFNPPEEWTFGALDPVFDHVRTEMKLSAKGYALYGHSAGAQFVHRFMLYQADAKVLSAVAANAGWYTLPTFQETFPYGLAGAGVSRKMQLGFLSKPLTVLLGDQDNDPRHRYLRRTEEAQRQGPHRFARGKSFFRTGFVAAKQYDVPFGWRLGLAPGVGHDNARMAAFAVPYLIPVMEEDVSVPQRPVPRAASR